MIEYIKYAVTVYDSYIQNISQNNTMYNYQQGCKLQRCTACKPVQLSQWNITNINTIGRLIVNSKWDLYRTNKLLHYYQQTYIYQKY